MKDLIKKVLEFYSDTKNYQQDIIMGYEMVSKIDLDRGTRAEELLKLLESNYVVFKTPEYTIEDFEDDNCNPTDNKTWTEEFKNLIIIRNRLRGILN